MLTLEEQERRAYISGDTDRAALLALAIDNETEAMLALDGALDEARTRADDAEAAAEDLREQVEDLGEVPCA